ncbi:unnamed protein product, partial [Vitis vinifera]|uniref:Uncharacterized protein n=1 Tax=Vitis vinifera TaxID=29760 RepID=D7SMS0_VITVI
MFPIIIIKYEFALHWYLRFVDNRLLGYNDHFLVIVALQIIRNGESLDDLNSLEYITLGRNEKKWRELMVE